MLEGMFSDVKLPQAMTIVSTAASVAASAMVVRSIAKDLVPDELQSFLLWRLHAFFRSFSQEIVLIVEEFEGLAKNQIYKAAETYLGSKISPSTKTFSVSMPEKETKISTSMAKNQEIVDNFNSIKLKWRQVTREVEPKPRAAPYPGGYNIYSKSESRHFELRFHKKHKNLVLDSYFPFVIAESKRVKEDGKTLKIYTLNSDHHRRYSGGDYAWSSVILDHPATFDTVAMDPEAKRTIIEDLERFVKRKDLYRRVGKAWKRGYLLYGPPGTGKSSLVAAMANYLNFDIYDLELSNVHDDSELRRLLIATASRCILVVEDIDCSLELEDRRVEEKMVKVLQSNHVRQGQTINIVRQQKQNHVTLSGLLNFVDGLWSSCGDERIIVFTTNHIDRLDPSLLRPGRMDVHIHMSYCSPSGFRTLAANYLRLEAHPLFSEIDDLLNKTMVTPAEIGEQLLKSEEPEDTLQGLIGFLVEKKREAEELEAKKKEGEEIGEGNLEGVESDGAKNESSG